MVNPRWVVTLLGLAGLAIVTPKSWAADLPDCPASVQAMANQALIKLEKRQKSQDEQLRQHPSASYATMNGPVLRKLEKRQQRERLIQTLQSKTSQEHHCHLKLEES